MTHVTWTIDVPSLPGYFPLAGEGLSPLFRLLVPPYPRLPALRRIVQTHSMEARRRRKLSRAARISLRYYRNHVRGHGPCNAAPKTKW